MSLYSNWTDMVVEYVKTKGEKAFWDEYSAIETKIYKDLLADHKNVKKVVISNLAKEYNTTEEFIMGFVDGINDSLTHVDFMIGSPDLQIVGETHDGETVQIFKDGNWAF